MKIQEIQTLTEGLTFGQKEISELQKDSNSIFIGWEFEWKLDEEHRGNMDFDGFNDEVNDRLQSRRDDKLIDLKDDFEREVDLDILVDNLMDFVRAASVVNSRVSETSTPNLFNQEEKEELIEQVDNLKGTEAGLEKVQEHLDDTINEFTIGTVTIDERDIDNLADAVRSIDQIDPDDEITEDYLSEIRNVINEVDNFDILQGNTVPDIRQKLTNAINERTGEWAEERADDLIDEVFDEDREREDIIEDLMSEGNFSSDITEAMRDVLENVDMFPAPIKQVVEDGSVDSEEGAEAISKIQNLDAAMDTLQRMLSTIRTFGYTDDETGLHMNVSFNNVEMDPANFNTLKFMLLMNEPFVRQFFPERNTNVGDVIRRLNYQDHKSLLLRLLDNVYRGVFPTRIDAMEHMLQDIIRVGKSSGLNLNNLKNMDMDQRRIEFRYMGGEEYEKNFEWLNFHAHRMIYMMKVGFDDEFAEQEYAKRILRHVDFMTEQTLNMSYRSLERLYFDYVEQQMRTGREYNEIFEDILNVITDRESDIIEFLRDSPVDAKRRQIRGE